VGTWEGRTDGDREELLGAFVGKSDAILLGTFVGDSDGQLRQVNTQISRNCTLGPAV